MMTESQKKIISTLLTITALGLGAYSALHSHQKSFAACHFCHKEGWFGIAAGLGFCYTLYLYQGN